MQTVQFFFKNVFFESAHKVAICLHTQAPAPRARRTHAPTRVCVCSSGRASAATVA